MNRFHAGEVAMQVRTGDAERLAPYAPHILAPTMAQQQREFFAALPFVVLAAADADGALWATLRAGAPGFIHTPDARRLCIDAPALAGDPLGPVPAIGTAVGLLGLMPHRRRRNRANGRVRASTPEALELDIEQSFGNCPKYIVAREVRHQPATDATPVANALPALDDAAVDLVTQADTFFVASIGAGGADASHRGGRPGFVKVEDERTLLVPDFAGNRFFMTLGNLLVDGRSGLLFVDPATRGLLFLSGRAEVVEGGSLLQLAGAERGWRFHLQQARRVAGVLPLAWPDGEPSPFVADTGRWSEVQSAS